MLKKGSSALKAAYLGSVIISLQVCRCAVPKRLRRRRNEQTNCDKYRWRRVVELQWTCFSHRKVRPYAGQRLAASQSNAKFATRATDCNRISEFQKHPT